MKAYVVLSLLVVIASICLAGCGTADPGTVSGRVVRASDGAGVSGAVVVVGTKTGVTDPSGNYTVPQVPAGSQMISVTATGYIQPGGAISVKVVSDLETAGNIIVLVPTGKQPPTGPGL